mgnify:CR=1 FL=1
MAPIAAIRATARPWFPSVAAAKRTGAQVRAAETPFGGTIAHGYLTLSLIPFLSVYWRLRGAWHFKARFW